jgi:hypothetical protein
METHSFLEGVPTYKAVYDSIKPNIITPQTTEPVPTLMQVGIEEALKAQQVTLQGANGELVTLESKEAPQPVTVTLTASGFTQPF